jgi:hypothetical protein
LQRHDRGLRLRARLGATLLVESRHPPLPLHALLKTFEAIEWEVAATAASFNCAA